MSSNGKNQEMGFSGKTPKQLLEEAEEHQKDGQEGKKVQALNSVLQVAFDEAYETGSDSKALEFADEVFPPQIQAFYGGKEASEIEYENWKEEFSDIEKESGIFHIPATDSAPYEYLRSCMDVLDEDYDQVIGVHSGGLAPLYAIEDVLDAESVVLRYSHRDRGDENVQITPGMEQKADFEGSDILVVDDVIESDETFREVGQYIQDRGAGSIDAVPVRNSMWDISHDGEMLDILEGGVKYGIIDYERKKDYSGEGLSLVS